VKYALVAINYVVRVPLSDAEATAVDSGHLWAEEAVIGRASGLPMERDAEYIVEVYEGEEEDEQ